MTHATELNEVAESAIPDPPEPRKQDVLDQCDRIASSDDFRAALSLQRLLRFLVSETLEGRASALKEYTVGLEVFQRSPEFDPRTDAIVRVTVGQLRRRLAAYYAGPGASDSVVIQIPKGHYAAEFKAALPLGADLPHAIEAERTKLALHTTSSETGWGRWWLAGIVLASLLVGALPTWILMRADRSGAKSAVIASPIRQSLLWSRFLHGEDHAIAVVGIASSAAIGPIIVRVPQLNDDVSLQTNSEIQRLSKIYGKPAYAYNVYTGIGEALAIGNLSRAFQQSSYKLSIMASHEARWQDLHADNAIFISSLHFRNLRNDLDRQADFTAETDATGALHIVNRAPKAGEQAVYVPSGNYMVPSVDYALVSMVPGTIPGRDILTVGGAGTLGTAGAMQYITERQSLAELDAHLKRDSGGVGARGLQIVLRVDIVDNQVVSVHYVTHHWLQA